MKKEVRQLLNWFQDNKRSLPWRDNKEPYRIWVSEIMLQQTRVEAVIPYFNRFMDRLPNVGELALCPEEELLKLWEGLGYYNRVRNMQKAAIQIQDEFQGEFPNSKKDLETLSGIGSYTAGAIASIAFGEKVPAVDGNVLRVWMRLHNKSDDIAKQSTKKNVESEIMDWIPKESPGDFTQAMMELGATICVPNGAPKCEQCPVIDFCESKKKGTERTLPVKAKLKPRKIQNKTILVIQKGNRVLLKKRKATGLLAGLYEFLNKDGVLEEDEVLAYVQKQGFDSLRIVPLGEAKHIFSHIEWHMNGYLIRIDETKPDGKWLFADIDELDHRYAIPTAYQAYRKQIRKKLR